MSEQAHTDYQRTFYDAHYAKREQAAREQMAHPLFRSFNERLARLVLDQVDPALSDDPVRVFEIGCGEGLLASALAAVAALEGRALSYAGADLSAKALELASEHVAGDFHVGGAHEVLAQQGSGAFDVIVAKNILHHVPDPTALLIEAKRVVGESGLVVAVEPRLGHPPFWVFNCLAPRRERYYFSGQRRNLAAMESAGLEVVRAERFSWLPFELALGIRYKLGRRLTASLSPKAIDRVSGLDDWLAATAGTRALAAYAVWVVRSKR